jgi:hypothetical protein
VISAEPSWGQVLATTVKLRVQRLHPAGSWPRLSRFREHSWRLHRLIAWRLVAALAVLAVIAVAAIESAGAGSAGTKALAPAAQRL